MINNSPDRPWDGSIVHPAPVPTPGLEKAIRPVVTTYRHELLCTILLYACVFENFALAAINNLVTTVSSGMVVGVQLTLTACAVALIVSGKPRLERIFAFGCVAFVLCVMLAAAHTGDIKPRFLYDTSTIPTFMLLGMTVRKFNIKYLQLLLWIVFAVAIFELVLPDAYIALFNPMKYFLGTRDWVGQQSGVTATVINANDFYFGSYRPGGSIFGANHRIGSIFLEPLSLGYFASICAIFYLYNFQHKFLRSLIPVGVCLVLAALSDSRTAVFLIAFTTVFRGVIGRTAAEIRYISPILVLAAIAGFYSVAQTDTSDLTYRLSLTFGALQTASLSDILFGGQFNTVYGDSGVVYIIANAGVLGFFVYLFLASGFLAERHSANFVTQAVLLYLITAALFGGAIFSIKTAAILGFGVGSAMVNARDRKPEKASQKAGPLFARDRLGRLTLAAGSAIPGLNKLEH